MYDAYHSIILKKINVFPSMLLLSTKMFENKINVFDFCDKSVRRQAEVLTNTG